MQCMVGCVNSQKDTLGSKRQNVYENGAKPARLKKEI